MSFFFFVNHQVFHCSFMLQDKAEFISQCCKYIISLKKLISLDFLQVSFEWYKVLEEFQSPFHSTGNVDILHKFLDLSLSILKHDTI